MVSSESSKPPMGDVWLVRFGSGEPGEPTKNRPAVVVNDLSFGGGGIFDLCVMVPLSTSVAKALSRPSVSPGASGLTVESVAIPAALRGLSPKRLLHRVGHLDDATMARIRRVLSAMLRC